MKMEREEDYICSLSWTKEGSYLAVGTSDCKVQVRVEIIVPLESKWIWDISEHVFYIYFLINCIDFHLVVGCWKSEALAQHGQPHSKGWKSELEWSCCLQVKMFLLPKTVVISPWCFPFLHSSVCSPLSPPPAVAPDLDISTTMMWGWQTITSAPWLLTHRKCAAWSGPLMGDTWLVEAMITWCAYGPVHRGAVLATTASWSVAGANIREQSRWAANRSSIC